MTEEVRREFGCLVETTEQHTAVAFGNVGVAVVATPALIGFLETAAAECGRALLAPGEATVGTMVNVQHRAAAPACATVAARACLLARDGRRLTFAVEARWNDTLLMVGTHERAIVDLERFMARMPSAPRGR